jgi:hypothetical protein
LSLKLFKDRNSMPGMSPAAMAPHSGTPRKDLDIADIDQQKQAIFGREQINRHSSIQW